MAFIPNPEHEQFVTEQGDQAADLVRSGLVVQPANDAASLLRARPAQAMRSLMSTRLTTTSSPASPTASSVDRALPQRHGTRKPSQHLKGDPPALGRHAALVAAATAASIFARTPA